MGSQSPYLGMGPRVGAAATLVVGIAMAAVVGPCRGNLAPAEYAYQIPNSTGAGQTGLDIVLAGDQTGNLSTYENTMGSPSSSAGYSSGSTTISYSGSAVADSAEATFGFSWSGTSAPDITDAYWAGASSANIPLLETIGAGSSGTEYAVVSIDPSSMDLIFSLDTTPNWDNRWSANNGSIDLSNAEYYDSPSQIPLDQLDSTDLANKPWQPIPGIPNGTTIQNGSSINEPLPEPATLGLLALGGMGILARRRMSSPRA
ncbi:MAG: PEP-CTERM sorting domain-containing protein [Phycisphaerae bacterium]|nr:PEP-CTERM sorting domain-containing protein [Phycisphaerae bacterium]